MFHVLLLEQNTIKKGKINKFLAEFQVGDDKEYEVETIHNSIVYTKEIDGYLLGLYYLVVWKGYLEKKNT